jgi:putative FmdB family regulatory protein
MPIYEYKCLQCGEVSEHRITSQSQVNAISCRTCGSQDLRKLMSVPSISTGKKEPAVQTCCGSDERCSEPGRCCSH